MAITVNLYTFSKKSNSTKRPTGDGTALSCELRDASSILAPEMVFKLNSAPTYNYMYVGAFSRYYYINDWTYDSGFWIASCKVDSLASHKTAIGNSTQYVVRSSHSHDGNIVDNLYPIKGSFDIHRVLPDGASESYQFFTGGGAIDNGTYVIGVVNGAEEGLGSTTYYALTQSQMNDLKHTLLDPVVMGELVGQDDISDGLLRTLFTPTDYITSCVWIPVPVDNILGRNQDSIKIGWWMLNTSAKRITNFTNKFFASFTISNKRHELAETRGNYLLQTPYSEYTLYFQPFGVIPLDSSVIYNANKIDLVAEMDIHSGDTRLTVTIDKGSSYDFKPYLIETDAKVGIDMSLQSISGNALQNLVGGFSGAGQLISEGLYAVANTVGSMFGIGSTNLETKVSGISAQSSIINANANPELQIIHRNPLSDDNADNGRPLMQRKTLADIPGYIVCQNGDIAINCSQKELDEIGSHLTSGFFFE